MRKVELIITIFLLLQLAYSAEIYNPSADAMADIISAISLAKETDRHVFVKVGGNWCGWCKMYAKFTGADKDIMRVMEDEYVFLLVNWSTENKNPDAMSYLGNPERFGFPVFVIIDGDGKVLHTQDSALLEEGKGYNKKHIMRFLTVWTAGAVDPNRVGAEK
jgi:thiol:disulfide interchange protein